jgi:hypothetical protein
MPTIVTFLLCPWWQADIKQKMSVFFIFFGNKKMKKNMLPTSFGQCPSTFMAEKGSAFRGHIQTFADHTHTPQQ